MAGYDPNLDFFALLRPSVGSQLVRRMPILDLVVKTLGDANLIPVYVGYTAPTTNQNTTAWLLPQSPSWQGPGIVMLWDQTQNNGNGNYVPGTPQLFAALLNNIGAITTESQGPPNSQIGVPGSVYFQTDTGQIWYKNAAGAWQLFPVTGAGGGDGGFLNRFRNGTTSVYQRWTGAPISIPISGGFGPEDAWFILPTGAAVTSTIGAGRLLTLQSAQVNGAAGNTDVTVRQRIASYDGAPLTAQSCTVQAQLNNQTQAAIVPKLTVKHAGAIDNWSSSYIDVNAVALQSCPPGQWTRIAYTFLASTSSANGVEVDFDLGPIGAGQFVSLCELDLRATPGMPIGLNGTPPTPELRSVAMEMLQCQRYFWRWSPGGGGRIMAGALNPSFAQVDFGVFPVPMRALYSVTDGNLSDLLFYDLINGTNGPAAASSFSFTSVQGYGYGNYQNITGNPLTVGHPCAGVSSAGLYHLDFNGEL